MALVGGSEPKTATQWADLIEPVAAIFERQRCSLVYCGMGGGLSGEIATRALARGVQAKAIVMRGKEPPDVPRGAKRIAVADYYARQKKLFEGTSAILVLPGGSGTLAELTTAAALSAAGLIAKPVVLDPKGWFKAIAVWYDKAHAAGAVKSDFASAVSVVKTPAEAEAIIKGRLSA